LRIALISKEYPPHVYGGAGVHLEHLARELARAQDGRHQVDVYCFGDQDRPGNPRVSGVPAPPLPRPAEARFAPVADAVARCGAVAALARPARVVHCHTWYTHLAGCLLSQRLGAPLVLTTHSLEPHRPWKAEQLGDSWQEALWLERTAFAAAHGVVAVSRRMREDVLRLYGVAPERVRVIPNGIDPEFWRPRQDPGLPGRLGLDPELPAVLLVARITRQKGILHFLEAAHSFRPGCQVVLAASAADTPQLRQEVAARVERLRAETANPLVWLEQTVPPEDLAGLYSLARVFVCPSVYEPFGIINLEAMACATPVVASAVGGIPEVVAHGETGLLVPLAPAGPEEAEPADPAAFAAGLAGEVNRLLDDPELARRMGRAGRRRVERRFAWSAVAAETLEFYRELIQAQGAAGLSR
jgi:glycogen synthase